MVWRWAVVGLAVVMWLPATAQVLLVEDPVGDQRFTMPDGRFRVPTGGQYRNVDVVTAGIWDETPEAVSFYVEPDAIGAQSEHPIPYGDPVYDIRFSHGLQGYRVLVVTFLENQGTAALGDAPETHAQLQIEYEDEAFRALADGEAVIDGDHIIATVPRRAILDHNQAPLERNATLEAFSVTATAMGWFGFPLFTGSGAAITVGPPRAWDRAPDSYFDDPGYKLTTGADLSRGALVAGSVDPVRWTNGEATTFVYTIRLTNLGDTDLLALMSQTGIPDGWQVAFSDRYTVPANSHINVTLHAAIPFSHQHGSLRQFEAHFRTPDDKHQATARLGVYWPQVPQPAGHHDQLWFHSRNEPADDPFQDATQNDVHAWLSAANADVDTADENVPVPADLITPPEEGRAEARWRLLLEPSLRMGLDFDLTRLGEGEVTFGLPVPVQDPAVELEIRHYDRRFILPRVTLLGSAEAALPGSQSGTVTFQLPEITPTEAADLVRYVSVADLEVNLTLSGTMIGFGLENPPDWTPTLNPGGSWIQLPLFEYHDPLEATFATSASAAIEVGDQGQEKSVNPGEQVVYNMFLTYRGAFEQRFQVELLGHEDWASVLGDDSFVLAPGERREVAIAVAPPENAPEGTIDTTIRAISTANAAIQAGMTVRTTVLRGADVADEADLAQQKAQDLHAPPPDPGFPWAWTLSGLAAAAVTTLAVVWRVRPEWLGRT